MQGAYQEAYLSVDEASSEHQGLSQPHRSQEGPSKLALLGQDLTYTPSPWGVSHEMLSAPTRGFDLK